MSTKSFFKNVDIKTDKQARQFVSALEKAEHFSKQEKISENRTVYNIRNSDVQTFMEKIKWND